MAGSAVTESTNTTPSVEEQTYTPSETEQPVLSPTPSLTSEASTLHKTRCPLHRDEDDDEETCASRKLRPEQEEEVTSKLLNPITISFSDPKARQRDLTSEKSKILPPFFYRTYYETSITLCSRVSKDTHAKHRERPDLKIKPGNAFQAVGKVELAKAVTKEGIERHLKWNKKRDPSQWISVFNELNWAVRRAHFHYDNSERIGDRVSIAEISTAGLVAATLSAPWEMVWEITTQLKPIGKSYASNKSRQHVDIPVWISRDAIPDDGDSITAQQWEDSGAELWVSIVELRLSDFKDGILGHKASRYIMAKGHEYEWLALGSIPESRILKVMPWDGDNLHLERGKRIVRSKYSMDDWVFDWKLETWRMDSMLYHFSIYQESMLPKAKVNSIVKAFKTIKNNRVKRKQNADGSDDEPRRTKLSRRKKAVPRQSTIKTESLVGTCTSCGCKCKSRSRREASI